jgi:hypothetical protein
MIGFVSVVSMDKRESTGFAYLYKGWDCSSINLILMADSCQINEANKVREKEFNQTG